MPNIDMNDVINSDDHNWTPVELALIACCRGVLAGKGVLVSCKAVVAVAPAGAAASVLAAAVAPSGGAARRSASGSSRQQQL